VPVDLSDNTNLWGPHPLALSRIREATADDLRCYPELYADTLRQAVSERFGVPADCVTTGAGSDDVLDSAFRASYGAGQTVAYPAPTFSMVHDLAIMNGMRPRPIPWPEAVENSGLLLEEDPAVVFLCRPNNPTGAQLPEEWVEALVDSAATGPTGGGRGGAGGPLVIVDEAYADFAGGTLVDRAPTLPKVLVTRTTSKACGLAGLRCGYAVSTPDVVLEIDKARGPYKVSRLAVELAAIAVRDEDGWIARTVAEALQNRERLSAELEQRGVAQLPTKANFIFIVAPSGNATADALALREDGVQLRPFKGVPGVGDGLRVTVGPWPLMERLLEALDRRLAALDEVASR
ncbi:MAG: histidinol-phosphate transaminase, partial [Gemmatimonadota bacterium]